MKKQRREDYTPLAIMETTFILGPRFKSLPISARCLYVALWCRAYQCRRGHLPGWYDLHAMRDDSRLDTRTIRKALATLQQHCLILYHADGTISVPGVHEKGRIRWKDSPQDFPENVKFDPAESTIGVNKAGAESHLESESKTESKLESGGPAPHTEKWGIAPPC